MIQIKPKDQERTQRSYYNQKPPEPLKIGGIYDGVVKYTVPYGIFVSFVTTEGCERGLVRISEISENRDLQDITAFHDFDNVTVKVLAITTRNQIFLSIKAIGKIDRQ